MMTFRGGRLEELVLPARLIRLMIEIAESKGHQQLFERQASRLLRALRTAAFHQSVECSNRLDGVTVAPERLLPIVLGHANAENQAENEIRGYAQALRLISADAPHFRLTADFLLTLHSVILEGAAEAGRWRVEETQIIEFAGNEPRGTEFRSVPFGEIPQAVDELCESYNAALSRQELHPLLIIGAFVFDLLCLHPFCKGNGRISRLLGLLCLYQHRFEIGRCISLEHLIEESREDYYNALRKSWEGWSESKHDVRPWLSYFLGMLQRAYGEFERRVREAMSPRGAMTILVETAIDYLPAEFRVTELERACPGVSHGMICRVLDQLKNKSRLERLGRGHAKSWRKKI